MIPFDFDYYKVDSIEGAVSLYHRLENQGKEPMYFSGGTEIITLGRLNLLYTDSVIDIRSIPELQAMERDDDFLYLGAGKTMVEIEEANLFPLLTKTSKEVADHTARTKITLGGNICANIFYREGVLPLLVSDSYVYIASEKEIKVSPISEVFDQKLRLNKGDLLIQICTPTSFIEQPHLSIKRRKQWYTGYPLITVVALAFQGEIRVAISGLCPYPFRSKEMEQVLNRRNKSKEQRVIEAVRAVPKPILDDTEGSSDYRLFVLQNTLLDVLTELEWEGE